LLQEQQTFLNTTASHAKDHEEVGYLCCRNIREGLGQVEERKERNFCSFQGQVKDFKIPDEHLEGQNIKVKIVFADSSKLLLRIKEQIEFLQKQSHLINAQARCER